MTAEAKRHLLLPPTMTQTEHLEQAVASTNSPTTWVRGSTGERTQLPDRDPGVSSSIQIQIALPIASETGEYPAAQPPPPPQVLFRAREVIRPPPASENWHGSSGAPGSAPSDPVDAPPGLADSPPGLDEDLHLRDEGPLEELSHAEDAPASLVEEPGTPGDEEVPQVEMGAQELPVYPQDYYDGAPGTHESDPIDAPPGLADTPPGLEETHQEHSPVPDVPQDTPEIESVAAVPPVRPLGRALVLPPVAHHQLGAPMEDHVKLAPPVRPPIGLEEPPEWKPFEEPPEWKPFEEPPEWKPLEELAEAKLVQPPFVDSPAPAASPAHDEPPVPSEPLDDLQDEVGEAPPGLELDAMDELEADMQLFGELDEITGEVVPGDDFVSEVLPAHEDSWEDENTEGREAASSIPAGAPVAPPVPVSVANEALESAWQARPLSERLAGASLLVLGVWAIWRIWSVL